RISLALSFVLHLAPLLPTLFPYTTLFRSPSSPRGRALRGEVCATEQRHAQYGAAANSGLGPNSMHGFSDWHSPPARSKPLPVPGDRKSTRLNSSHQIISYAVFCLKKKNTI